MRGLTYGVRSLAVVVGVALVASCGTPTQGGSASPAPSPGASSPSDEKLISVAGDLATRSGGWALQQQAIDSALNRATNTCMTDAGYPAPADPPRVTGWTEEGAVDMPTRRRFGYGLAAAPPLDHADSSETRMLAAMSDHDRQRYLEALLGESGPTLLVRLPDGREIQTPRTGCVASGRAAVFGSIEAWATVTYVPESFGSVVTSKVQATPIYRHALERWRTCASGAGVTALSPDAVVDEVRARYATDGINPTTRSHETTMAVVDGQCALEAHLPRAAAEARRQLLAAALDDGQRHILTNAAAMWVSALESTAAR